MNNYKIGQKWSVILVMLIGVSINVLYGETVRADTSLDTPQIATSTQEKKGLLERLKVTASGALDMYSNYIWRGFTMETETVIQPSFNLSAYGLTCSFWGNWDVQDHNQQKSNEIDYTLDYTYPFPWMSVSAGYTYYDFNGIHTYSKEVYGGISFPQLFFSPALKMYFDYGKEEKGGGRGQYLALTFFQKFPLTWIPKTDIALVTSGRVAFNNNLFIRGRGGDALMTLGINIPLAKGLTFFPNIDLAVPFGDLRSASDGNQRDRLYGGFSISYSF